VLAARVTDSARAARKTGVSPTTDPTGASPVQMLLSTEFFGAAAYALGVASLRIAALFMTPSVPAQR